MCGGCTYQNLPYEKQVEMKEAQIHAMMDAAVDGDYIWEGVKESPVRDAYRNKMEFSFGDEYKDGPLALGMHKRGIMIYKIIDEKCLKQSAVARAAGYDPKKFNALLRGRKRLTSDDVVPICKALGVTPNELFGIDHPTTPEKSA